MSASERRVLSADQVQAYFDRLQLPDRHRKLSVAELSPADALAFLAVLQKYHLQAIPFENLSLHYSQHHSVSISIDALFKKMVLTPGRGGYCMENNALFGSLLLTLGYQLYSAGGRVAEGTGYTAWSHMVNLVTIGDQKYLVDVGFGSNAPVKPLPLIRAGPEDASPAFTNIAPASARLVWKNIGINRDPSQRLWVYQHRVNDDADWVDTYCFTELEFVPRDYALMNYYTSTSATSWFTQRAICARMLLGRPDADWDGDGGDAGEEVVGTLILTEDFKRRIHGAVIERQELKTEQDRLEALEAHFGIKLSTDEREGIKGLVSEIKPRPNGPQ